jgi:hypothetical protein
LKNAFLQELIIQLDIFDNTFSFDIYNELRADTLLTLDVDRSSHLFDDFFADGKAKSCALLVPLGVFI